MLPVMTESVIDSETCQSLDMSFGRHRLPYTDAECGFFDDNRQSILSLLAVLCRPGRHKTDMMITGKTIVDFAFAHVELQFRVLSKPSRANLTSILRADSELRATVE